jgi:hypothetical protein
MPTPSWLFILDHLLPRPSRLSRGHHAAMPYEKVAAFVEKLRQRKPRRRWRSNFASSRLPGPGKSWECAYCEPRKVGNVVQMGTRHPSY